MSAPTLSESLVKQGLFFINTALDTSFITVPPGDPETSINDKQANNWLRWNLAWFFFFCIIFIPLPLWLYPVTCLGGFIASVIVTLWLCLVMLACMVTASITMFRMFRVRDRNWSQDDPSAEKLIHMVVMAGYKEPLDLILATVESLKVQTVASRLFVVIGLEERTPEFDLKRSELLKRYQGIFLHIMVTKHPYGQPGEVPGKCSNVNYATRQGTFELWRLGHHSLEHCIYTTCDTDNVFHPKYFEYLGFDFLRTPDSEQVVWQAPLMYNYNLDQRPFFVRVTGILRGVFMMGILIPQNINTMSVFSMSLALTEKGFIHPSYQMDDIINIVRRMIRLHKLVKIRLIPYAVVSGPTSGENFTQEVVEWARQARRWTIGAAEVFHYFCIKWRSFGNLSGIYYAIIFTHYYGFVICGMSLFNFVSLISTSIYNGVGLCVPRDFLFSEHFIYFPLVGVAFSYIFYLWAFIMDALATRLLNIKEDIGVIRNFLHWLSAPFVLLAYSFIEFFAIVEVAIYGKAVCKHGASKKNGLVQKF